MLWSVAPAVAGAAIASGVARLSIDLAEYKDRLMRRSANLSLVGVLCRDTGAGRVRVDHDGSPRVRWRLNAADEARMAEGVAAAGEVLAAAGAGEVFSLHRERLAFRPGDPRPLCYFLKDIAFTELP